MLLLPTQTSKISITMRAIIISRRFAVRGAACCHKKSHLCRQCCVPRGAPLSKAMALSTAVIYVAAEMKHWHESMVFGEPFIHSTLVRRRNYHSTHGGKE
jgi:hypothetical protein